MSGIYINKRDTIILLSVLLLINPFIACLSSILFLKMGNQHIRVCAFFIAIFIGLLAFTQYSPNGDISRTYHMINSVTDFSLGSFLIYLATDKYLIYTCLLYTSSMQQDPFFEMYSSVDERSAAYMACGMAAESGEPVVLTCTSATASRNYVPGLTEAYYRKLPVLAITSTTPSPNIGHHHRQAIDRSVIQKDIANLSIHIPIVKDNLDEWDCIVKTNKALSELTHRGLSLIHIFGFGSLLSADSSRAY